MGLKIVRKGKFRESRLIHHVGDPEFFVFTGDDSFKVGELMYFPESEDYEYYLKVSEEEYLPIIAGKTSIGFYLRSRKHPLKDKSTVLRYKCV